MLKSWGASDPASIRPKNEKAWEFADVLMFMSEETWACVIIGIALIIYEVAAWSERNPVFGAVFIWALGAILNDILDNKPDSENLLITVASTLGVHSISMIVLTCYLIFEELQPWYQPLSFWGGGSFGFTDWSLMFRDFNTIFVALQEYFTETYSTRAVSA